jgi:hypothetical protein
VEILVFVAAVVVLDVAAALFGVDSRPVEPERVRRAPA